MDPYKIIKYPLATEKAVRLMETENKLVFVVNSKSTKPQIKNAIEEAFKVKVLKVNTTNTIKGKKKAYISLAMDSPAMDVATQLGLI